MSRLDAFLLAFFVFIGFSYALEPYRNCPVSGQWYLKLNEAEWQELKEDFDLSDLRNSPVASFQLLYYAGGWSKSHTVQLYAKGKFLAAARNEMDFNSPWTARPGFIDNVPAIPSPLSAAYRVPAAKKDEFFGNTFPECQQTLRGYLQLYQLRVVLPNELSFWTSFQLNLIIGRLNLQFGSAPVNRLRSLYGRPIYSKHLDSDTFNVYTHDEETMRPKYPEMGERTIGVTKDIFYLNHDHNTHLKHHFRLGSNKYLTLEFHQFHHMAPSFEWFRSLELWLMHAEDGQMNAVNPIRLGTFIDATAQYYERGSPDYELLFGENSTYTAKNGQAPSAEECERIIGCRIVPHPNFEVIAVVYRQRITQNRSWTKNEAFNRVTGQMFSYRFFIKPKRFSCLKVGWYFYEFINRWNTRRRNTDQMSGLKWAMFASYNRMYEIRSNTAFFGVYMFNPLTRMNVWPVYVQRGIDSSKNEQLAFTSPFDYDSVSESSFDDPMAASGLIVTQIKEGDDLESMHADPDIARALSAHEPRVDEPAGMLQSPAQIQEGNYLEPMDAGPVIVGALSAHEPRIESEVESTMDEPAGMLQSAAQIEEGDDLEPMHADRDITGALLAHKSPFETEVERIAAEPVDMLQLAANTRLPDDIVDVVDGKLVYDVERGAKLPLPDYDSESEIYYDVFEEDNLEPSSPQI